MCLCNCKCFFDTICKESYIFDFDMFPENINELKMFPLNYYMCYFEYERRNIISSVRNDENLFDYIFNNYIITTSDDNICYRYISSKLLDLDASKEGTSESNNIEESMMNYLYWSYGSPYAEDNYLRIRLNEKKELERMFLKEDMKEKYRSGTYKVRTGQKQYREDLINVYNKCQVCGLQNKDLLVASHIKTYKESEYNEAIDFNNGFLLCRLHDGLFDKGLISFDDDGSVIISNKLNYNDRSILNELKNIKINVNKEQKKYLKWHRKNIFKT